MPCCSDGSLQRLCCAPELRVLVLLGCSHITEYGLELLLRSGSLDVVAVQGCAGINEKCVCLCWFSCCPCTRRHGARAACMAAAHSLGEWRLSITLCCLHVTLQVVSARAKGWAPHQHAAVVGWQLQAASRHAQDRQQQRWQ